MNIILHNINLVFFANRSAPMPTIHPFIIPYAIMNFDINPGTNLNMVIESQIDIASPIHIVVPVMDVDQGNQ